MDSRTVRIGTRVSYEDMANPRRFGTVIDRLTSVFSTQYQIGWDDAVIDWDDPSSWDNATDWSDLRQAGWRNEDEQEGTR